MAKRKTPGNVYIIRAYAVHGRDDTMQHMIYAFIFSCFLYRQHVFYIRNNTNKGSISCSIFAYHTSMLAFLHKISANGAEHRFFLCIKQIFRKFFYFIIAQVDDMKRKPLRCFISYSGQFRKLVYQPEYRLYNLTHFLKHTSKIHTARDAAHFFLHHIFGLCERFINRCYD